MNRNLQAKGAARNTGLGMGVTAKVCCALVLAGATLGCQSGVETVCDELASERGGVTVGGYATTLRGVRQAYPAQAWPGLTEHSAAIVCFIDGPVPKAPPAGAGEPFDRAVFVVINGSALMVAAGYQTSLPIRTQRP